AQLRQVRNGVTILGVDCDIDQSMADDFGQWGYRPQLPPVGHLDMASCDHVVGWTADPDQSPSTANDVEIYLDGPPPEGTRIARVSARVNRSDLCSMGGCDHGFDIPLPAQVRDGAHHAIFAYGIDVQTGAPTALEGSASVFCPFFGLGVYNGD